MIIRRCISAEFYGHTSERRAQGWVLLPKRGVVERTFAWLGRSRRLRKDYERRTESSEAMVRIAAVHLLRKRLAPNDSKPEFHCRLAA